MNNDKHLPATCPIHGAPTHRSSCGDCNKGYMRGYQRRRRVQAPAGAIWERARRRASRRGLPFLISPEDIKVPPSCPALGIEIIVEGARSSNSPSLDRIRPERGYIPGNIRVISDRANRLKGARSLADLRRKAEVGPLNLREEYGKVASYADREALLSEVRNKAAGSGRCAAEWAKVADFLDRAFTKALPATIQE